jgi:hypothetical protein
METSKWKIEYVNKTQHGKGKTAKYLSSSSIPVAPTWSIGHP